MKSATSSQAKTTKQTAPAGGAAEKRGPSAEDLLQIYGRLYEWTGPRHWWPAETPFEVVIGAILTQNVSWRNVEKAIASLRDAGLLNLRRLAEVPEEELYPLIRPTGYFRSKAKKLKAFCRFVDERFDGSLERLFSEPLETLRPMLLGVYGIGPETADAILCYAAEKPIMVMDAYTRRVFSRLGLISRDASYDVMQRFFMSRLPTNTELFNEYHADIDGLANRLCLKNHPKCGECPLLSLCPTGQGRQGGGQE